MVPMTEDITTIENSSTSEKENYRNLELVSYFLFAVGPLVGNAVLVLLGAIAADFTIDPTVVLFAIPAFMFPFAIIQLFSGAMSDVYGRVPVIAGGLVIFALGLFLTVLSSSIEVFALANIVAGAGFGFVNPVLLALLSDCAPPGGIPKRMGITSALANFSIGLGPFIAGQMVGLGWKSYYLLFLIIVIFGLIAISSANRPSKKDQDDSGVRVLITNLRIELKKSVVILMLPTSFLVALTYLGILIWTSRGLTEVVDENLIGLLLLGSGVSGAVAGSQIGKMIEKRGYKLPILIGFLTLFIGLSLLILVGDFNSNSNITIVGLALVAIGWTGGQFFPILIIFSQMISPKRRGVLAGVVTFSFFLGSALIPIIYEPLFHSGITMVYIGIFGASLTLLLCFIVLFKHIEL